MARRVASRGFAPRARKSSAPAWGFLGVATHSVIGASSKVLLGTFILSNPPLGETVLRTRARLSVITDQAVAAEQQIGAFGLIVVTDRAAAAGAVSIPGPFTDGGDDGWFVHQIISQQNGLSGLTDAQYDIDSKAMRKIEDGGEIAIMVENGGTSHGFNFIFAVRLLAKLTQS